VLAPTPFAHQVNIRLQQCCVVLVGVYPATPVVCWRFRCFRPGSLLGTTGHTAQSPPGLGVGVLWCHVWWSSRGRRTHLVFFEGPLGQGRVDVLPQRFLPSRCNHATPGWRAPSWGPMDRGGRENPPGRSGMTSGGGGVDLPPGVDRPTSCDPLSQSDGDEGDPRRGSLFRPKALPVGPIGVRPPAGAPSVRSNTESLHPGAGILFGGSRPARVSRTERPSPTRVGWTVPTLPREPPGGRSSRAPRGSEGVIGPELVDAITHVVRTEVARSLQGSPAVASVPGAKARTRRGGYSSPRRRLVYTSQSSDGEYSGGDSPYIRTPGTQEDSSWTPRRTHASIPRGQPSSAGADYAPIRGRLASSVRAVPSRITVNNPQYKDMFDCETYALEKKSALYAREQANNMGRLKKDISHSFGSRSECEGTPPHKVFQFLRKFAKACDDSFVSEGEAFYVLQDFNREPLRSEVMAGMPTRRGGNPGEVTSYLELATG